MASLFRKARSPFWYVRFRDREGNWQKKATGYRADDPGQTLQARALRAEVEKRELTGRAQRVEPAKSWDTWVPEFFVRHCRSPKTRARYEGAWKLLALWLQERGIHSPAQMTYALALEFIPWRTGRVKRNTRKQVSRNTAVLDLKILAMLCAEAVRLGHATSNPLASMRLRKDRPKQKRELTDAEISRCRDALAAEPEWMGVSFEIALQTGCRLRETIIPTVCVHLVENRLTFPSPKGGEDRAFSIPIPDALRPLLARLIADGRKVTLEMPFQPSKVWGDFFRRTGIGGVSFHCLRVTKINRLRREGVPREVAMRLVNHSSEMVHRIYQRERVDDLARYANAGTFPPAAGDTAANPPGTPAS